MEMTVVPIADMLAKEGPVAAWEAIVQTLSKLVVVAAQAVIVVLIIGPDGVLVQAAKAVVVVVVGGEGKGGWLTGGC